MSFKEYLKTVLKGYTEKLKSIFVKESDLAAVAKTGKYTDLKEKPSHLSTTGGKLTGLLTIYNGGTDQTHSSIQTSGNVIAGHTTKTAYSMLCTVRKCENDNNRVSSSAFFTNSNGTAKFVHKAGVETGTDDAYMLFGPTGFIVAYSGQYGVKPTKEYELRHAGNCYSKEEVNALIAPLKAEIETLKNK